MRSAVQRLRGILPGLGKGKCTGIVQLVEGNGYNYEAAEVMRCLRAGALESEVNPLDDTIGVMKVMDVVRREWGLRYPSEAGVVVS